MPVALVRGLAAFALVALAGQIVAALIGLFGGGLARSTTWSLGWFTTLAFHRVAIDVVTVGAAGVAGAEGVAGAAAVAGATGAATTYRVSIAFLLGTGLAMWLLYRGGGAAAARAGSSIRSGVLAGAMVAPAYAAPVWLLTAITRLELQGGGFLPDAVRVQGVVWQALAFPAALAIVAGGSGGAMGALSETSRPRLWLTGGWRTLLVALGLAFVGVLALAAARPQGLATYARGVSANGARVALLLTGGHVLLLPNQSFLVLSPSMGGCVSLRGPVATVPLLCPGRLPVLDAGSVSADVTAATSGGRAPASRSMPAGYWAFTLVPAVATVLGGRWACAGIDRLGERLSVAAGSGVVFGILTGIGTWASGVAVQQATLGAPALPTGSLALVWGLAGGVVGALLARSQEALGPADPPPSPTSV